MNSFLQPRRAIQVTRYLQWHRRNEGCLGEGRKILLMNLDETSVSFAPEQNTGLVVTTSHSRAKALMKKQDSRTNLTYVAIICDDEVEQKSMPHFIIGDQKRITQQMLRALPIDAHCNTHIIRNERKAWNNHQVMQKVLKKLHDAISCRQNLQPVLILDVAECHSHKAVMQKARDLGIWLVFVPSHITFLVQPLDTHGFAGFKAWLRQQYAQLRSQAAEGLVNRLHWLQVLQSAKASFFDCKSWVSSFSDTGARLPCERLTRALSTYVDLSVVRNAAAGELSAEDMRYFWPKRRRMQYAFPLLTARAVAQPVQRHAARVPIFERTVPEPAMSIALASRSLKRACRQQPCRSDP